MNCPSPEEIARVAVGCDERADVGVHLDECGHCRASLAEVRALAVQLSALHDRFDRGHERARARLMATLSADGASVRSRHRMSFSIGVLTMRQRIAAGSVGLAAVVAFLLLWSATKPPSAIAQMAENIRRAKSYTMTMDSAHEFVARIGKPPVTSKSSTKWYWLAPGSYRMETTGDQTWQGKQDTEIYPHGGPGIDIDHKAKTFRRMAARRGHISPLMILDELSKFSGQADRELGTKQLDGKKIRGFEIEVRKIDPDFDPGVVEIWIDAETDLPVLLRCQIKAAMPATITMRDFQWNIELDKKLFDTAPPEGYTDSTPKPEPAEKILGRVIDGLTFYAEVSEGRYPQGTIIYGDVVRDELYRMTGIQQPPTREQNRSEKYVRLLDACRGFTELACILRDNADAAYHGKTVGPKDADKLLLRWQLDDGRYQVLFGDLRAEIVTRERLRPLEGK